MSRIEGAASAQWGAATEFGRRLFVQCTAVLLVLATGCDTQRGPGEGPQATEEGAPRGMVQSSAFSFPEQSSRAAVVPHAELSARHEGLEPGEGCATDEQCASPLRCHADVCAFPPAMTGEVEPWTPRVAFLVEGEPAVFHLELAVGRTEQARGLMHRRSMVEDYAMLFWYAEEQPLRFWMDQTLIPLDMIFVDDALTVVHVEHEAEPLTRTPRGPGEPSRYVVEVRGGLARSHGIRVGQHVVFDGVERALGGRR